MLYDFILEEHVKSALKEDLGFADITTEAIAKDSDKIKGALMTRETGILCGSRVFKKVFEILSPEVTVKFHFKDGDKINAGDKIADIEGSAKYILIGERTALNYIQRMSGIATETNKYVKEIKGYKAKIVDTRKTTPNFREFEKYSVKTGGGSLHRFNLSDCVMIKDNHIRLAGSITKAVESVKEYISHAHKIEVECDTLEQVKEALQTKVEIIMLDNMNNTDMKKAVEIIKGKAIVEASGNVKIETIKEIAETGVDIISSSAIVAKAKTLDLALDI